MRVRRTTRYVAVMVLGFGLGAASTAWLLASELPTQPKYRLNDHGQAQKREIMALGDPCLKRTGGYDLEKDPCTRTVNTVPEPGALSLVLLGSAILLWRLA